MSGCRVIEYSTTAAHDTSTVVSLHAHSCYSKESLAFLPRLMMESAVARRLLEYETMRYVKYQGHDLDFSRTSWRPPLTPSGVIASELEQAVGRFDRPALTSVTDHDTVDGQTMTRRREFSDAAPISFEWTVYAEAACFHLGVHNLPAADAADVLRECAEVTRRRDAGRLVEALAWLREMPAVLVVLNHPFSDGQGIGAQQPATLRGWLDRHAHFIDALEINGYRDWSENGDVIHLAEACRLPVVAGGDRHARAPNAVLNLSRARTFAEYVAMLRTGRGNTVVVMPEYREHRVARVLEAIAEVLRTDGTLAVGRRWIYRVFHDTDEHGDLPVAHYWDGREPWWLRGLVGAMCFIGSPSMRAARRLVLAPEQGAAR